MSSDFIIPHGKYRGKALEEIPCSYLSYIVDNWDHEEILIAVEQEQQNRRKYGITVHDD